MVVFFLQDTGFHVWAPQRWKIIGNRTRIFFPEHTQDISHYFAAGRQFVLIDGTHEVLVVHGPFARVCTRLWNGQAYSLAALAGFHHDHQDVTIGTIGCACHYAVSVAYLADIVVGVARAFDGLRVWREVFPTSLSVVGIGVPHFARVAIRIVVAIGAASACFCGGRAAGCPDGGPGLGGEAGGGPSEEEQREKIEQPVRGQAHGLSPEFANSRRLRKEEGGLGLSKYETDPITDPVSFQ